MTNLLRFDFNDRDGVVEVVENGHWVRATDYDALDAKLAEVEAERDQAIEACGNFWTVLARAEASEQLVAKLEAALVAVYRLALADAVNTLRTKRTHMYTTPYDEFVQTRTRGVDEMADMIEASPTPTADALMARITEEKN